MDSLHFITQFIVNPSCTKSLSRPGPSVHFLSRWVKQEDELTKQAQAPDTTPKLDLGFKEGQTITLNIGVILRPS